MRKLTADEIDVRVSTIKENGLSLLLYKDARVDMRILDEEYGQFGWQCRYEDHKGVIYCGIGILNPQLNEWIWKWDAGAESYTEKEKGEASDAFKRAAFRWGIGRELYTAPFIWIQDAPVKTYNDKKYPQDRYKVRNIEYQDDKISFLTIDNQKGVIVYSYGTPQRNDNRE